MLAIYNVFGGEIVRGETSQSLAKLFSIPNSDPGIEGRTPVVIYPGVSVIIECEVPKAYESDPKLRFVPGVDVLSSKSITNQAVALFAIQSHQSIPELERFTEGDKRVEVKNQTKLRVRQLEQEELMNRSREDGEE